MVNQIAKQLRLLPTNHKKILCDSKRLLSSFVFKIHSLFLTLAITTKIMKVQSIVRSIWNCTLATSTRPCRTISIDSMLLSKVRSTGENSNETNTCFFQDTKNTSRKWPKKKMNTPTNSWNIKTNVVVPSSSWTSRFVHLSDIRF